MSSIDREIERRDDLNWTVRRIAVDVGAVTVDPDTNELFYNHNSEADRHAYARAMTLRKRDKLNASTIEIQGAVKRVLDEAFSVYSLIDAAIYVPQYPAAQIRTLPIEGPLSTHTRRVSSLPLDRR